MQPAVGVSGNIPQAQGVPAPQNEGAFNHLKQMVSLFFYTLFDPSWSPPNAPQVPPPAPVGTTHEVIPISHIISSPRVQEAAKRIARSATNKIVHTAIKHSPLILDGISDAINHRIPIAIADDHPLRVNGGSALLTHQLSQWVGTLYNQGATHQATRSSSRALVRTAIQHAPAIINGISDAISPHLPSLEASAENQQLIDNGGRPLLVAQASQMLTQWFDNTKDLALEHVQQGGLLILSEALRSGLGKLSQQNQENEELVEEINTIIENLDENNDPPSWDYIKEAFQNFLKLSSENHLHILGNSIPKGGAVPPPSSVSDLAALLIKHGEALSGERGVEDETEIPQKLEESRNAFAKGAAHYYTVHFLWETIGGVSPPSENFFTDILSSPDPEEQFLQASLDSDLFPSYSYLFPYLYPLISKTIHYFIDHISAQMISDMENKKGEEQKNDPFLGNLTSFIEIANGMYERIAKGDVESLGTISQMMREGLSSPICNRGMSREEIRYLLVRTMIDQPISNLGWGNGIKDFLADLAIPETSNFQPLNFLWMPLLILVGIPLCGAAWILEKLLAPIFKYLVGFVASCMLKEDPLPTNGNFPKAANPYLYAAYGTMRLLLSEIRESLEAEDDTTWDDLADDVQNKAELKELIAALSDLQRASSFKTVSRLMRGLNDPSAIEKIGESAADLFLEESAEAAGRLMALVKRKMENPETSQKMMARLFSLLNESHTIREIKDDDVKAIHIGLIQELACVLTIVVRKAVFLKNFTPVKEKRIVEAFYNQRKKGIEKLVEEGESEFEELNSGLEKRALKSCDLEPAISRLIEKHMKHLKGWILEEKPAVGSEIANAIEEQSQILVAAHQKYTESLDELKLLVHDLFLLEQSEKGFIELRFLFQELRGRLENRVIDQFHCKRALKKLDQINEALRKFPKCPLTKAIFDQIKIKKENINESLDVLSSANSNIPSMSETILDLIDQICEEINDALKLISENLPDQEIRTTFEMVETALYDLNNLFDEASDDFMKPISIANLGIEEIPLIKTTIANFVDQISIDQVKQLMQLMGTRDMLEGILYNAVLIPIVNNNE